MACGYAGEGGRRKHAGSLTLCSARLADVDCVMLLALSSFRNGICGDRQGSALCATAVSSWRGWQLCRLYHCMTASSILLMPGLPSMIADKALELSSCKSGPVTYCSLCGGSHTRIQSAWLISKHLFSPQPKLYLARCSCCHACSSCACTSHCRASCMLLWPSVCLWPVQASDSQARARLHVLSI